MLARLDSAPADQLMNCWAKTVKDVWGVPRATHSVYARWLSSGHSSIKEDLLSRWPKFFRSLLNGPSPEAATLARVAAADRRSATAANNALIFSAIGLPMHRKSELLPTRAELNLHCDNIKSICAHIDFLVTS